MNMKEKYKFDLYEVYEKGKKYQVIVMPRMKNMYVFDGHPQDRGRLFVDGDKVAYKYLKLAYSILIKDSSKLIYFPCKHDEEYGDYYEEHTKDYVIYRWELQFRRSVWYRIKDRLDGKHYKGKYILVYEQDKQLDWLKKQEEKEGSLCTLYRKSERYLKYWENNGNVAFEQFPRDILYLYFRSVLQGLRKIRMGKCCAEEWLMSGCLFSDSDISYFREDLKEEGRIKWEVEKDRGYEIFRAYSSKSHSIDTLNTLAKTFNS